MFICKKCLEPDDTVSSFMSWGPCEICGTVGDCHTVDIHSPKYTPSRQDEDDLADWPKEPH